MPWAGYERDIAPYLTRFEKRAISYTQAYSISCMTARSVGGLLSGKYPSELFRNGEFFSTYYPENLFFTETLQQAGHVTLGAFSHAYFVPATGITQGFDDARMLPGTYMKNMSKDNITSERITGLARRMLEKHARELGPSQRFFAYFHYMDPHAPYLLHEGRPSYGSSPRDRYDQEVHFTDEWVGKLIDWVHKQDFGKRTAIIVTGDHGEAFGEHGPSKHAYELWQEVLRVPLLFEVPGFEPRHIDTPRSHIDLAPTILQLMGVDPNPELRGKSLVPELKGAQAESRPVVADLPRDTLEDRRRALILGSLKLIAFGDDDRFFLFDLAKDPGEKHNLTAAEPALFSKMKKAYMEASEHIEQVPIRGPAQLKGAPPGRRW